MWPTPPSGRRISERASRAGYRLICYQLLVGAARSPVAVGNPSKADASFPHSCLPGHITNSALRNASASVPSGEHARPERWFRRSAETIFPPPTPTSRRAICHQLLVGAAGALQVIHVTVQKFNC
jgi:hypothetical protein